MGLICAPSCVTANKPKVGYTNSCGNKRAPGGIPRLLFLICDPNYVHPVAVPPGVSPWTVPANVKAAMCAGLLNFTGPVLGEKPASSTVKKQMSSCNAEEITGGSTVINFQDYNVTTDENGNASLEEFDFWDWVKQNYQYLLFGWVTCDELMFLYDGNFVPEVSGIIENTNTGNRYYGGSVTMPIYDEIKPVRVPGILSALAAFRPEDCYS